MNFIIYYMINREKKRISFQRILADGTSTGTGSLSIRDYPTAIANDY